MKVLITYASKYGSTAEVAERVGKVLKNKGLEVQVLPVKQVKDISAYDAVVIGSPFMVGKWLKDTRRFVKRNQETLLKMPVACFGLGLNLKEDTEENRAQMMEWLSPIREMIDPVDVGLFGDRWDKKKAKGLARMFSIPEGDFRDWDKIESWAEGLVTKL